MNKPVSQNVTHSGIGFLGLLTIVLVILKATGYLEWGWLWVFAPVWMGAICMMTIIVFVASAAILMVLLEKK